MQISQYKNTTRFIFPSCITQGFRYGSTSKSYVHKTRTTLNEQFHTITQFGLFVYLVKSSVSGGLFETSTRTGSLVETVDGTSHYRLTATAGVTDAWLTNHFGTLLSPIEHDFGTPFKMPFVESSDHRITGVTMPATNTAALTEQTDLLGDIPASYNCYINSSGKLALGSITSTTNVTGKWVFDTLGDGSISISERTQTTPVYQHAYDATVNCGLVARYVISPVITQVDFYTDGTTTNAVYTTGAVAVRTTKFSALTYYQTIPW